MALEEGSGISSDKVQHYKERTPDVPQVLVQFSR